jgi:hypothetical protein
MILVLSILLAITYSPEQIIATPYEFNRISFFDDHLYFAAYTGANIFFHHNDSFKALTISDNPLSVIEDFCFTPFFLYLNDGQKITKHYLRQSISETIYHGDHIAGFCLLNSEELVILDRRPNRILILDRQHQVRTSIYDLPAKDIAANTESIFILANNDVVIFDHHLNFIEKIPLPQSMTRIIIARDRPVVFTPGRRRAYIYDNTWHQIDFENNIRDIATDGINLFILEDYGNTVRIHNISDH